MAGHFSRVICGIRAASARPESASSFRRSATVKTETDGRALSEGLETGGVRVDGEYQGEGGVGIKRAPS